VLRGPDDVGHAWKATGQAPAILEAFVRFERELSVLSVRAASGETRFYPLVENHHEDGMLRISRAPARGLTPELQQKAEAYAARILERLGYVGVLALELFEAAGELYANEMAPRVHNSGHLTIEAAVTSQFENHLRAILDLPLGSTAIATHAAMINLVGSLPERARVLEVPGAHLHFYGKEPRRGRKVGHVTVCAADAAELETRIEALCSAIGWSPAG
jgi:5-(carboxyamino)imidazole ribonucleotide synthase